MSVASGGWIFTSPICVSVNSTTSYLTSENNIGHFRVPKPLTFKMRLGAQPFLENEFYLQENERLTTYPSFETETRGNSEMAYCYEPYIVLK